MHRKPGETRRAAMSGARRLTARCLVTVHRRARRKPPAGRRGRTERTLVSPDVRLRYDPALTEVSRPRARLIRRARRVLEGQPRS
ncbi:hypothetical protein BGLA2_1620017 [Burkholderia gladioli]|nr:hypothetical protein BGLA2_1620017 [Burkholderia gladioli]